MEKKYLLSLIIALTGFLCLSFKNCLKEESNYLSTYQNKLKEFNTHQTELLRSIKKRNFSNPEDKKVIQDEILQLRKELKSIDFWLRYLEPISYKKINGPLPVEWETEVFEKFEKPYKREGAGLTLAFLYLDEEAIEKDSLANLIQSSINAVEIYHEDSISTNLTTYHHFFLCNRLYLLNLAAIYTTGFECPDTSRVIPELNLMIKEVRSLYTSYNHNFSTTPIDQNYLTLYDQMEDFASKQSTDYSQFDHYTFIRNFVNPLFRLNQEYILQYKVTSKSNMDYSINKSAQSIFSKNLYQGQNPKGIYLRVKNEEALTEIDRLGKLLFYDPILSGNNLRSCASCHKPTEYFTDTVQATSLQFDRRNFLERNSPSLLNVEYNHLIMLDGKHISLQNQTTDVIFSHKELGSSKEDVLKKVMSCKEYKTAFNKLLKYTPQESEVSIDHLVSAITFYYSKFSKSNSLFDASMNTNKALNERVVKGFNLFMSKAQCATCHFVPQFNGVKPPYTNSEFEVIGVPATNSFESVSADLGRYQVYPEAETYHAFRTGTIRNAKYTAPYMHNGVFKNLRQVIDFYDQGGGTGRGLAISNQTLSSDALHLTEEEKNLLIDFIHSLSEDIPFEKPPAQLPESKDSKLCKRIVGGVY